MSSSDPEVVTVDLTWLDVPPHIPSSGPMNTLLLIMREEITLPRPPTGERGGTLSVPCGCTGVAIVIPDFL
jgi:hypothetical protein